jgi:mRNA interferase RelE/StbE
MTYKITFKKSALKELLTFPKIEITRILSSIDQLAINPRPSGAIKLSGNKDNFWRIRFGDYRVLYLIDDLIRLKLVQ